MPKNKSYFKYFNEWLPIYCGQQTSNATTILIVRTTKKKNQICKF